MQYRHGTKIIFIVLACLFVLPVLAHEEPDLTKLPVGDGKLSTEPKVGYVMRCGQGGNSGIGGAQVDGPWFSADKLTFDFTAKAIVDGDVTWPSKFDITVNGDQRVFTSNDLPNHGTGVYPIASSDDAYQYDRNPNSIQEQELSFTLPVTPTLADQPSCLSPGPIAILLTGSVVFDALDAMNRDAVAHETQDACQGHPEVTGEYHYHSLTTCLEDDHEEGTHSALMGYAMDGFGIYGHYGENGELLTNDDLDECHGHTHEIMWEGKMVEMYHYHATYEYPYTIGCFRGTPISIDPMQGQGGQNGQPPAGGPGGQQGQGGQNGQPPAGGPGGQQGQGGQNGQPPAGGPGGQQGQGGQNGQPPAGGPGGQPPAGGPGGQPPSRP